MKIFVFEFITGGGLRKQPLPESLANEGELMLQALISDLSQIPQSELYITRDSRLPDQLFHRFENVEIIKITQDSEIQSIFAELCRQCDAVWPIAPESDNVLLDFSRIVESSSARLLNSAAGAVKLAGNKLLTYQLLTDSKISVINTQKLSDFQWLDTEIYVIKPNDGVGCENCFLINNQEQLKRVVTLLEEPDDYIVQPFIQGRAISLSCLFKNSRGWLICVNEQKINIVGQKLSLEACEVNIAMKKSENLINIIDDIAQAIPGLWGYVGIDLIDTGNGYVFLEINPRLTTSYAGIKQALGLNVAANVFQLIAGEPDLKVIVEDVAVSVSINSASVTARSIK